PNASKRLVGVSFLRLCVNTKSTGFIIGKGGSGIEEIKTTSHIEITVDNSFEPFKGVNEYFVTLVGSINGIIDALKTIICRLPKQFDHVPEGEVCKQIVIPWGNAGKLIGKGGETIRRMNEDTHTNISITRDTESPADRRNRCVSIIGKEEDVNRAVERVKEITGGAELASYPGNVSYRASVPVQAIPLLFPKNEVICAELREFTSVVCRPAPEEDSVPGFTVHGVDVYGAPADVVTLTQRMEEVVKEWVEKKTIDPTAIVLKLVFNKQIVGVIIGKSGSNLARLQKEYAVEIRLANSPCYTAVDLECVVYITGTVAGILECVHALLGQMEKNAVERRLPVDTQLYQHPAPRFYPPYAYPAPAVNSAMNPMAPHFEPQQPFFYGAQVPPLLSAQPAPPTLGYTVVKGCPAEGRVVIGLPADRCGNVLGKRGVVMNFIKASTLCTISMQKREEVPRNALLRETTVSGSPEGIERAVRIMHLFINLPASDIDILVKTPFSLNVELQRYLAPYPDKVLCPMHPHDSVSTTSVPNGSEVREPSTQM
ncbi:hypothetical protein WA556_002302, partial [Blastocystis sp. ATCC 50177/Nand II]